ncbi:hypothetical protein CUMW_040010 [Citrus unshiu]|nr:hypothetical protein CUMW_040010 [Citrus unshiu]
MELFLESMQLDITMSYGRNYYISRRDMLPYMDSLELRTPSYIMMIFVNNVQYYVRWLEINVEILLSNCDPEWTLIMGGIFKSVLQSRLISARTGSVRKE